MSLPPALSELEQSVNRVLANQQLPPAELESTFGRARAFVLESSSLFREVEDTLFADDMTGQKLRLCEQEMSHFLTSLEKLQQATLSGKHMILKERLTAVLTAHQRCLEYFSDFSRLAGKQPIYSPNPVYDSFIKTGIKVIEKQLDAARLSDRFATLLPEINKVSRQVALFPKLHTAPGDLMTALQQGLQGLQTAYGAISAFLEQNDETALKDGLKLLGSSSVILAGQLEKAELLAQQETRYTPFRPLEEWLRLKDYISKNPGDAIPEPWITSVIAQVFFVWDFVLDQAQRLLQHPLLDGVEVDNRITPALLEECWQQRVAADKMLGELNGPGLLTSSDHLWLEKVSALESLQKSLEATHKALEHQMEPFKELPALENISTLKERVKRGEASKDELAEAFQAQIDKVEDLLESVGSGGDPFSVEFRDLLPLHRSAFIGMMENLQADDWAGLDARWQGVLTTLPHLAHLSRTLRQRLAAESSASKQVMCVRCQAKNEPFRRVCSTCGASLPTVVQKHQSYSEIDLDEGRQSGTIAAINPSALDLLENMVRGLEQNRTSKRDAADALKLLIQDVDRQRKMFTQKLLPLMGKDDVLDAYLRYFAQGMGQYFANLMELLDAVEDGSLALIHSSLSVTRDTLETLEAMKERVDGALRG